MQNTSEKKADKVNVGNKLLGVTLAIVLIVTAFLSGIELGQNTSRDISLEAGLFNLFSPSVQQQDDDADLRQFWQVWNILEDKFVNTTGTPDTNNRIEGAISGLVDSYGDPYTVYMPPSDAAYFAEDISGNFSGVGMEVGLRDKVITVISPLPDTPAEQAGIKSGDIITKIDDQTTEKMNVDEAVRLIRGEKGTEINLTLYRQSTSEFIEVSIVRDTIKIPTVETSVENGVFTIRLFSFNALSESAVRSALLEFKEGDYDKLILDLRGNPGGFLESAVNIAGYFLPAGKVVVRESFGENKEEQLYRTPDSQMVDLGPDNFVILMDGGSASASEILAGALSEHGAATTIGETTFGKGSVQELINLPDNSAVKVTIARWLTPEGVSFSEGGLDPEIKVTVTPETVASGTDVQRKAALEWLNGNKDIADKIGFQF